MSNAVKNKKNSRKTKARAFLRWVGGKRFLVPRLLNYLPANFRTRNYHEPFAGAANLFFSVAPEKAFLSDLNEDLIETYKHIRDNYALVSAHLLRHRQNNKKEYYYQVRDRYNQAATGPAQAARFVYLNRACFNGVFRVNTKGEFNVPYGRKRRPFFPSTKDLKVVSRALEDVRLVKTSYKTALSRVKKGEFVYLDPPYPPLNGTSFFTHYTTDRFSADDQVRLATAVRELHRRGGLFLMTNADLPKIRKLYRGFKFWKLRVTRSVSCKGNRYRVGELVITNYTPASPKQRKKSRKE